MKTFIAAIACVLLFKGVSYGEEIQVLKELVPSVDLGSYSSLPKDSGEYCLHGVSYLVMFGSHSITNVTLERDRNGKPIPCVTKKTR